jgi:hypothetical protein
LILRLAGAHGGETGVVLCPATTSGPTTCNDHTSVMLLPDTYDIFYESVPGIGPGPVWPAEDAVVAAAVDVHTSRTIAVDIPVVHVMFTLVHAGAPLDPSALGGREVHLEPGSNFGAPIGELIAVLPGPHDVTLDGHWPELGGTIGHVVIGAGGAGEGASVPIDVDLVTIALSVTANGTAAPAGCAPTYELGDWNGSDATSISLLRGTYPLRVLSDRCPAPWPSGSARVTDALVAEVDGALALDVHTVRVGLDLTYGGGPLPATTAGAPAVVFVGEHQDVGAYVPLYEGAAPAAAHRDVWLGPGVYDVVLLGSAPSAEFPQGPVSLATGVVIDADRSLALDVGSVQASVTTAIAGDPPEAITQSTAASIELVSRPPAAAFPVRVPHVALTTGSTFQTFVPGPVTVPLPGASYDLRYVGQAWHGMPGGVVSLGCWTVSE